MTAATLERVAQTTGSAAAEQTEDFFRRLFDTLPWATALNGEELLEMVAELRASTAEYRRTGSVQRLQESLEDWQATAEAIQNRGLWEALADPAPTYVPWAG
jgi:hypothetical protein